MGNWRTVNIEGSIDKDDVIAFRNACRWEKNGDGLPRGALEIGNEGSVCGIDNWVSDDGSIDAIGNLYERDYENDDIYEDLKYLASKFPNLSLVLHSGSDWESLTCSATFYVNNGTVEWRAPEIDELKPIEKDFF